MATKTKYLGNIEFQSAATGGNFAERSIQLPDIGPQLAQRRNELSRDYDYLQKAGLRDLELEQTRDDVRLAHNWEMGKIKDAQHARFVEQLSKTAFDFAKRKTEQHITGQINEGHMMALNLKKSGIELETITDAINGRLQIKDGEIVNARMVGSGINSNLDTATLRKLQNLGHYKKVGLLENLLKTAASKYPADMAERGNKGYTLPPEILVPLSKEYPDIPLVDEQGNPRLYALNDKDLQGKEWTSQIRAVINSEIQKDYLSRFEGIPTHMLDQYLYPAIIKNHEAADAEHATAERKLFIQEQVDRSYNNINSSLISGQGAGESFIREIEILSNYVGSRSAAVNKLWKEVLDGVDKGVYKREQIQALLDHKFIHHQTGKEVTIGENWEAFLTANELENRLIEGEKSRNELEDKKVENADEQLGKELTKFETERIANGGKPLTNGDLLHLSRKFNDEHKLPPGNVPNAIKNYLTNQTRDGIPIDEWLQYKLIKNGGLLTEADLKGVPISLRAKYLQQGLIDNNGFLANASQTTWINDLSKKFAKQFYNKTGKFDELDTEGTMFKDAAVQDALFVWQEVKKAGGSDLDAKKQVFATLTQNSKRDKETGRSPYEPSSLKSINEDWRVKLERNKKALTALNTNGLQGKIAGISDDELGVLDDFNASNGRTGYPEIVKYLANRSGFDPWAIANSIYKSYGKGDLVKPSIVQQVEGLSMDDQQLLLKFPSLSKSIRATNNNTEHDRDENIANNLYDRGKYRNIAAYRPNIKPRKLNITSKHWSNQPNVLLPSLGGIA